MPKFINLNLLFFCGIFFLQAYKPHFEVTPADKSTSTFACLHDREEEKKGGGETGEKKEREREKQHFLSVTFTCVIAIGVDDTFSLKLAQSFKSVQTIQTLDVTLETPQA